MIKRLLLLTILLFTLFSGYSQTFGNEWINYSQQYYTFQIVQTGIHRINYDDLSAASIPLSTFSHDNIQIFGREREIPIWVETNGDGSFDSGDYILFHADKNDGWIDSSLYIDPDKIGNPGFNLFNDTILYFFTWNNSTSNLRFELETDTDFNTYTPIPYAWTDYKASYAEWYIEGEKLQGTLSSSFYVAGEGYGKGHVNGATGYSLPLNAVTYYPYQGPGAPDARFLGLVASTASADTIPGNPYNHHSRWIINGTAISDNYAYGHTQIKTNVNFPTSLLSANSTPLVWAIIGDLGVATDYQALSYWSITYPRELNFAGNNQFDIRVPNSSESKIRLDMTNLGYTNPVAFSLGSNPQRLTLVNDAGTIKALMNNSADAQEQRLVYGELSNTIPVSAFMPVNGLGYFTNYSTHNFDEALLMVYHSNLTSGAQEYRNYRTSIAGGSYNAQLYDVDELYLQFGGGVRKHINGIRRFVDFAHQQATDKPVGLFLIGKGVSNSLTRTNPSHFNASLIPTWGVPASDILITSNLPGTTPWVPLLPTGRISVNTNEALQSYLSKVMEFEVEQDPNDIYDTPNKDWQKHAIHLVGGTELTQQLQFQFQMVQMEDKFTDTFHYGGIVHTIKRDSDAPIAPGELAEIMDRIESGVSIMTYYGHYGVGGNGFEINLDDVDTWGNQGRYPLMIANSCFNGNIFEAGLNSSSEYFVGAPNSGAIGYISSVTTGFHPPVGIYSNQLYREFCDLSYGEPIGVNMRRAIATLESPNNLYLEVTASQMLLNGDPMIRVNSHEFPEIELLEQNVSFAPNDIDLNTDSIEMTMVIKNLGRSIQQPYTIEIRRDFPGTEVDSLYIVQRSALYYTDTVRIKFPLQPNISIGLNSFDIRVDIPNFITEQYDEINNNQINKTYFLNVDGILPASPYDFAVVPNNTITLRASTINPIAEVNSYRFQIDTTDLFNSPELRNAVVSGLGGVKEVLPSEWDTPLTLQDSTVYFWRVAIDETNPNWSERSFQYIDGKSGWGQDHFFQYKKNNFVNINYSRPDRLRLWEPDSVLLSCDVYASYSFDNAWYLDGTMQDYATCGIEASIHVAVVDPLTFEAWGTNYNGANPDHDFGNIMGCRGRVEKYFVFRQTSLGQLQAFQNMVLNEVPDGHHLLIYTPNTTRYDLWNTLDSANMYQTFATLGSDSIIPGRPNGPFAFYVRKGYPNTVVESVIDPTTGSGSETGYQYTSVNAYMIGSDVIGNEITPLIGPAYRWGNVYWKQDSLDLINNTDTTRLIIQAYTPEKVFAFESNLLFTANDSLLDLNNTIDAALYPYIRLKASYKDTTNFTPAQIDRWHVLYDHVPEAAIDGSNGYTWTVQGDSINEGEDISFAIDVRNIFDIDMDSLKVNYWIEDNNHVKHFLDYPRQDSLRVTDILRDTITFSTAGYPGYNILWMEINPYISGSTNVTDQPEQEHFNNIVQVPFFAIGDDENPLLDVTFNGRHILNGDIVDPNSEIYITLKDDNEYLIMDDVSDTTLFGVYLTDPNGNQKRIPFVDGMGNTVMQWIPAESQHKRFKIIYPAAFEMDGTYKLLVQGTDRSGNLSGDMQYKINFEVIHASTITQMMNYPNPFSTSTRFVFTLTGSEIPDDIIIQIMTVSGRVVREITEDELGLIHIGRNITEFAWDGTDEFGDPLANGVYLYNVRAKINGEDIEHRESGADQYFKKNFGKMYLMR